MNVCNLLECVGSFNPGSNVIGVINFVILGVVSPLFIIFEDSSSLVVFTLAQWQTAFPHFFQRCLNLIDSETNGN